MINYIQNITECIISYPCWYQNQTMSVKGVPANNSARKGSLQLHHNDHNGVSNHQPHGCLLHRLLRLKSKKTSMLRVTGFCAGNSPGPVNSPQKGPVRRKMFPFDDVIMLRVSKSFLSGLRTSSHALPTKNSKTKQNKNIWIKPVKIDRGWAIHHLIKYFKILKLICQIKEPLWCNRHCKTAVKHGRLVILHGIQ